MSQQKAHLGIPFIGDRWINMNFFHVCISNTRKLFKVAFKYYTLFDTVDCNINELDAVSQYN